MTKARPTPPGASSANSSHVRRRAKRRDGIVLIAALICLLVSALTVANIFTTVRMQRQHTTRRTQQLQAAQLAQAGMQRAIARLAVNSDYNGEIWQPQVPSTGAASDRRKSTTGRVQIAIEQPTDKLVRLDVVVEYPFGAADQIRKSITWSIPAKSTTDNTNLNTAGGRR